ncbi:MAG: hypothetical protein U5N26_09300 [Candidatus Marinimicrobia bacterium]|nr:hypothetical protein [Candidatus Neomarinimicrobiota bacterium]
MSTIPALRGILDVLAGEKEDLSQARLDEIGELYRIQRDIRFPVHRLDIEFPGRLPSSPSFVVAPAVMLLDALGLHKGSLDQGGDIPGNDLPAETDDVGLDQVAVAEDRNITGAAPDIDQAGRRDPSDRR